jgi:hypothetical protein
MIILAIDTAVHQKIKVKYAEIICLPPGLFKRTHEVGSIFSRGLIDF